VATDSEESKAEAVEGSMGLSGLCCPKKVSEEPESSTGQSVLAVEIWPGSGVGTGGGSPRLASKPDGGETADENGLSGRILVEYAQ
jgi:hypothetical protein